MGAGTGTTVNPYVWQAVDYQGAMINITVNWNNATRALTGATVFRDSACVYTKIHIGKGADGKPEHSTRTVPVPASTTSVTAAQLSAVNLHTIDDFASLQITAS